MRQQEITEENKKSIRGLLLALLVIPVGVALWVILWSYGFIASLVAFGIAFGATWLYKAGSGREKPTVRDAWLLVGLILVAVILAFLGGVVSDVWQWYAEGYGEGASFFSADFFAALSEILTTTGVWSEYTSDIVISVVFAALGAGGLIRDLFVKPEAATAPTDKE